MHNRKSIATYIVNSFTDQAFKGNPAGVCILEQKMDEQKMLFIAKELGLSETAFILKNIKQDNYVIRFFSPKMEIPLCGHATLAASKVIFERQPKLHQIHFVNIQQLDLIIKRVGDSILMEFPIYETTPAIAPKELLKALGISKIINSAFNQETNILLLEIADCKLLKNLKPDYEALVRSHDTINGVLVTALSNQKEFDFESRYFWPWSGTNEDPVTGGTSTFLSKYWGERLGKTKMNSFQCSERTGFMEVELISEHIVVIKSKAQIILKGELLV